MIVINFFRQYETNWDKLQEKALKVIENFEKEVKEIEVGELSVSHQHKDYKWAVELGMKTFIMQVLNEWEFMELLVVNDKFYKKFESMELDGYLRKIKTPNIYKTTKDLFKAFNEENFKLSPDEFDEVMDNFEEDVVANMYSFEYEIREINEDGEWLDDNGFGDILD